MLLDQRGLSVAIRFRYSNSKSMMIHIELTDLSKKLSQSLVKNIQNVDTRIDWIAIYLIFFLLLTY